MVESEDNDTAFVVRLRCPKKLPSWMLPGTSGALMSLAWWLYIDAVQRQRTYGYLPRDDASWMLPGMLSMLGACMMVMTPLHALQMNLGEDDDMYAVLAAPSPASTSCARCWLFASFLTSFAGLMTSLLVGAAIRADGMDVSDATTTTPAAAAAAGFPEQGPLSQVYITTANDNVPGPGVWAGIAAAHRQHSVWPASALALQSVCIFAAAAAWLARRTRQRTQ